MRNNTQMCSIAHEGYDKVSDQPIWGGRNFLRAATIRLFCYIQQPSVITEGQRGVTAGNRRMERDL